MNVLARIAETRRLMVEARARTDKAYHVFAAALVEEKAAKEEFYIALRQLDDAYGRTP